jgi:tetratricopeptide (TPR) repeat protein
MQMADEMTYSLKQAAEVTGKTKPTLLRAIQKGRLAARQDSEGRWRIEPTELERVFGVTVRNGTRNGTRNGMTEDTSATIELLREIRDELRQLSARLIGQPTPLSATPAIASAGTVGRAGGVSTTPDIPLVPEAENTGELEGPTRQTPDYDSSAASSTRLDSADNLELADVRKSEEAVERQALKAARELFDRGAIALAEKRYADAAAQFKAAAAGVPGGQPGPLADCLDGLAAALYREGCERGDNAALKQSIETWRSVLQYRPRDQVPLDWAAIQTGLGAALTILGDRESNTALLTDAVAVFRAALEERTRDRVPRDWAATQHHLDPRPPFRTFLGSNPKVSDGWIKTDLAN